MRLSDYHALGQHIAERNNWQCYVIVWRRGELRITERAIGGDQMMAYGIRRWDNSWTISNLEVKEDEQAED